MPINNNVLLNVEGLKNYFPVRKGIFRRVVTHVKAVDDVNFFIRKGETLGLVGESGCGKTTTARSILRLIEPTAGKVSLFIQNTKGQPAEIDVNKLGKRGLKDLRKKMQIIFQDPYSSLNPRMTVGDIIGEVLIIHRIARGKEKNRRVQELLEIVGLRHQHMKRFPHEFSGGQRQRIGVARALALAPQLIICDEPVTALDVSIQAQILNLLNDLQSEFGLTYLFIAHDLSVIKHVSNRVVVMYLGKLVEMAKNDELFKNPKHPYTESLISAVPAIDPDIKKKRIILKGDVPSPIDPPSGCNFHPRCPYAQTICNEKEPEFKDYGGGHYVSCHFADLLEL